MRTLSALTLLALLLTGCGGGAEGDDAAAKPTVDLKAAVNACNVEVQDALNAETGNGPGLDPGVVMRLADDEKSLDVSPLQAQEFLIKPSVAAAVCVLRETKAPDSVRSEISQVTGLDGRQKASWDGVDLTYGYNGNTGFSGVFTATS